MKNLCLFLLFLIPLLVGCHPRQLQGATPLITAAINADMSALKETIVHSRINQQDATGKTALMYAIIHQHFDVVKYLISHKANVNLRNSFNGTSPLMYAAAAGSTNIVKYLVNHGAAINDRNVNGVTALIAAGGSGNGDNALYLLEHDARFNHCNRQGQNVYAAAIYWSQSHVAKRLATYAKQHNLNIRQCEHERFS